MSKGVAVEERHAVAPPAEGMGQGVRLVHATDGNGAATLTDAGVHPRGGTPRPALYVDLDHTLVRTDLLVEGVVALLKKNLAYLFLIPVWLWWGKANLKEQVALRVELDAALLPYDARLLAYLREEAAAGRTLVLATASNRRVAQAVAAHLGIFSDVIASDRHVNRAGEEKLKAIGGHRRGEAFAYAGDSRDDLPLFQRAATCILVNAGPGVERAARRGGANIERVFVRESQPLMAMVRAMRPHQWAKNLLLLVPLVVSHRWSGGNLAAVLLGIAAFSLCASAVYLVNDLFDLPADRAHARKRFRPLASGALPVVYGGLAAPAFITLGMIAGALVSMQFLVVLLAYLVFTTAYTVHLKSLALIDVMTLAGLYTMRIVAGATAIAVMPSFWLLAFSMFAFLSLALVKRCAELQRIRGAEITTPGRGYVGADYDLLQSVGVASGYVAVLVIALYINSPDVTALYGRPAILWLLCPAVMYWFSRLWLKTGRCEMHDDPLVFSFGDRGSRVVAMFAGVVLLAAL